MAAPVTEIEYEPLSDDAKAAIAAVRFITPNIAHTWALLVDRDKTLFDRIGIGATPYKRAEGITEYEAQSSHPEILALAVAAREGTGLS